jgi:hypothetical protein
MEPYLARNAALRNPASTAKPLLNAIHIFCG